MAERSFAHEVGKLRMGQGQGFRGEGILAVTKALLQELGVHFAFEQTEHGWFQIHAYQFSGDLSTVIVETREETWRAHGLDGFTTQQSIEFARSCSSAISAATA